MPPVCTLRFLVAISLAWSFLLLAGAACDRDVQAGYAGPYPSAAAQSALHAIAGRTLPAGTLGAGRGPFTIGDFGVLPDALAEKGPVVILREPGVTGSSDGDPDALPDAGKRLLVPIQTDGDAADLVQRATGALPTDFGGDQSDAYREALALDER